MDDQYTYKARYLTDPLGLKLDIIRYTLQGNLEAILTSVDRKLRKILK